MTSRRRPLDARPPLIGVVVPTHNRRALCEDTLRTVLFQSTTARTLVVVVDDGSTDGTCEHLARRFRGRGPTERARFEGARGVRVGNLVILRKANGGVSSARNLGLRFLYGIGCRFFSHQDSDDLALPWKLEVLRSHMLAHPQHTMVHAKSYDMSFGGVLLTHGPRHGRLYSERRFGIDGLSLWERATRNQIATGDLERRNYIHNQTTMYRREILEALGLDSLYRETLHYGEDYELHQRIDRAGLGIGFCDRFVAISRMTLHGLSADATHRDLDLTIDDLLRHGRTSTRWLVKLDCYLRAARRFGEATPGGVFGGNLEARKDCEAAIRELRRWILTRVRAGVIREAVMLAPFLTLASASEANRRLARSVKRAAAAVPWSRDSSAGSRRRRYKRLLQAFALLPTQRNARALLATSRRV